MPDDDGNHLPEGAWPLATLDDFKRALDLMRMQERDTGRMGLVVMLGRLFERQLDLEKRLAACEAHFGPRFGAR